MRMLLPSQAGRRDRERWLSTVQGVAARAAYATTSGRTPDPRLGLALLDQGQAVLLAAALTDADAGVPADRIPTADPSHTEAAVGGPVVALCATARGGRALLLLPSGKARHLALPTVTTQRVADWAAALGEAAPGRLRTLLTELGQEIMEPVLAACPDDPEQITLLPAGSLRLLPLHAAATGINNDRYAVDRVRISYAPNLTSLACG